MRRPLGGGRFLVTVAWRLAAYVAIALAAPFIAAAIQQSTNCASKAGACVAISVATGTLLPVLVLGLLALFLMRPCWRRARTLGLFGFAGLIVPALIALDWRFMTGLSMGLPPITFRLGILNSGLPFFAILAALIVILFAIAPTPAGRDDTLPRRHWVIGWLGWLAALAALILGAASAALYVAWASSIAEQGFASPLLADAFFVGRIASIACLIAMVPFVLMILVEIVRPRRRAEAAAGPA